MHVSYKKLAFLLLSPFILSSKVFSITNFEPLSREATQHVLAYALEGKDLKTLNSLARTSAVFNQIVLSAGLQIELIKFLNFQPLSILDIHLKNYAMNIATHILSNNSKSLDTNGLKELRSFYAKFISNGKPQKIENINSEFFILSRLLAERGEKTEAYKVARIYFLNYNYLDGAKYAKLSEYKAEPNDRRPIQSSNIFVFVNGLTKANDFSGVKQILKNYYKTNGINHFTIDEFIQAIPMLKQHMAELKNIHI
ncbi:MAG: hypothetical protein BGO77_04870 [Caedibacter sp. 37-49]|nr:MAG: hypothetical protein BGO77_04870 [Caedibacter sp. 37-49]